MIKILLVSPVTVYTLGGFTGIKLPIGTLLSATRSALGDFTSHLELGDDIVEFSVFKDEAMVV